MGARQRSRTTAQLCVGELNFYHQVQFPQRRMPAMVERSSTSACRSGAPRGRREGRPLRRNSPWPCCGCTLHSRSCAATVREAGVASEFSGRRDNPVASAAVRSSCWPPVVSAAAGALAPVGFKQLATQLPNYSHLKTMASPARPQACMVSQRDLLEKWEADVAVWDCWFADQKRLYDAQRQEPDEMRRLRLANQQWVQEEEERRLEEPAHRCRANVRTCDADQRSVA